MESNKEIIRMKHTLDAHTKKLDKFLKKKPKRDKLTRIKYIGVLFDEKKCKKGEEEINNALDEGYEVMRDFETGAGIVVCLAKWEKPKKSDAGDPETTGSYCDCEVCTE
jgi:hypothetical protein